MKKILPVLLLLLASCSTYLRTPATRMIPPEANGKLFKGSLDLVRIQNSRQHQMDFTGNTTETPLRDGTTVGSYGFMLDMGLFNIIDFYVIPYTVMSPTLIGGKIQVYGKSREEAKKGNFSASLAIATGSTGKSRKDGDDEVDIFDGGVDQIEVQMEHHDAGLVLGYRWLDPLVHYANAFVYTQEVNGKVTNNSATLVNAPFEYKNSGTILSSGLIFYFSKMHLKIDYSHMTTNWTYNRKEYVNSVNGSWGLSW